jgi:Toxin PAAR-like domain
MFPASTKEGGQCFAFPDVCKTPAPPAPFVPIPYPNIAMGNQADGGTCSSKVKINGQPTIVKGTEITMSSGDEGGTAGGGMVSSKFKGPAQYKMGSSKVKCEGKELCQLTSMTAQNGGSNANIPPGQQVAPSQTKVLCAK